jgi:hypothetical protein
VSLVFITGRSDSGLLTRREWHREFSLLLEIISKEPIETEVPIRLMSSG